MLHSKRRGPRVVVAILTVAMLMAVAPAALADGGSTRKVVAWGDCDGASHWKLRLSQHRRFIGVGFVVDSGVPGEIWRVKIVHGRHRLVFADLRRTSDPGGSFAIRRPIRNTPGPDVVRAKARNLETGELCFARSVI